MKPQFIAALVVFCVIQAGCSTYGNIERDFGKSYARAKYGQIQNPDAGKNPAPVTGLEGKAAAASMDRYVESFSKPANGQGTKGMVVPVIPAQSGM